VNLPADPAVIINSQRPVLRRGDADPFQPDAAGSRLAAGGHDKPLRLDGRPVIPDHEHPTAVGLLRAHGAEPDPDLYPVVHPHGPSAPARPRPRTVDSTPKRCWQPSATCPGWPSRIIRINEYLFTVLGDGRDLGPVLIYVAAVLITVLIALALLSEIAGRHASRG
jgi:hypothetical protein